MSDKLRIGQEILIHGYVEEIRKDIIIIRNEGGYFGTVECEIIGNEISSTNEVLDKIREEAEQIEIHGHIRDTQCFKAGMDAVLNIIDKYEVNKKPTCGDCKELGTVNCSETYREPTKNDNVCESFRIKSEE